MADAPRPRDRGGPGSARERASSALFALGWQGTQPVLFEGSRAVRCCVGGASEAVKHATHAGALRALWAGGSWTQARKAVRAVVRS
eukprot:6731106-Pyramimonas_sp.AAC.1